MTLVLTPGQRRDAVAFEHLMAGGTVKRGGGEHPKRRPRRQVGDKAYSSGKIRQYLRRHGIRMTIPRKQNEHRTGPLIVPGALAPSMVSWHADAAASLTPQATRRRRGGRKGALEFLSAEVRIEFEMCG